MKVKKLVSVEVLVELMYGELTPNEAIELENDLSGLDYETQRKAILVRTQNVCERLLLSQNVVSIK